MATEVAMPRLGDDTEEGTILKWLVEQGGEVKKGEPLVEIETDKASGTYDAELDGTLEEILVQEGDTVAVGEPIARVEESGDSDSDSDSDEDDDSEPAKVTPIAERMADDQGVDPGDLEGSGSGGKVTKDDVAQAGGHPGRGAKGEVETVDLTRLQQNVSRRVAESKATAPDYTLTVEVDMSVAVELPKRLEDHTETPPSEVDMVIKAVALALREHPRVNGAYRDGKFEQYSRVNVGVALAAQDATVVPVIFDADGKSLGQIASDVREATRKAAEGELTQPDLSGGTFTVIYMGSYGIDELTGILTPPQAAMLTLGALKKRPVVDEDSGRVTARETMRLTLVADQRILYGEDAAAFLARVRELLEQPLGLTL